MAYIFCAYRAWAIDLYKLLSKRYKSMILLSNPKKLTLNYVKKINPEFITTGNIGCITQIANGTKIPILHTVEIIDWYTGGPKPKILRSL